MMMKKYDFQDEAVDWLFEKTLDPASKKTIVLNAPTGSGKTVILIKYIDRLLKEILQLYGYAQVKVTLRNSRGVVLITFYHRDNPLI